MRAGGAGEACSVAGTPTCGLPPSASPPNADSSALTPAGRIAPPATRRRAARPPAPPRRHARAGAPEPASAATLASSPGRTTPTFWTPKPHLTCQRLDPSWFGAHDRCNPPPPPPRATSRPSDHRLPRHSIPSWLALVAFLRQRSKSGDGSAADGACASSPSPPARPDQPLGARPPRCRRFRRRRLRPVAPTTAGAPCAGTPAAAAKIEPRRSRSPFLHPRRCLAPGRRRRAAVHQPIHVGPGSLVRPCKPLDRLTPRGRPPLEAPRPTRLILLVPPAQRSSPAAAAAPPVAFLAATAGFASGLLVAHWDAPCLPLPPATFGRRVITGPIFPWRASRPLIYPGTLTGYPPWS